MTKQIVIWTLSVVLFCGVAFCTIWTIVNFDKVKSATSGTNIYDSTDLENAYKDGYDTALTDKAEYTDLINEYRDTITGLNDTVSYLNIQIATFTNDNQTLTAQVANLQSTITSQDMTIGQLQAINTENQTLINNLNSQISTLISDNETLTSQAASLQSTITSLNTTISQLQATNTANQALIDSLNFQNSNLQVTIANLNTTIQANNLTISNLNNQIANMQTQFNQYATLLQAYDFENTVIVTFMFKGQTYNMQVVTKGTTASITNPVNPAFAGWTIDGETTINLATYTITENTTFIAKILTYTVGFEVDGLVYGSSQTVEHGLYAIMPSIPSLPIYHNFLGWSVDGETVINPAVYQITGNTTFIAVIELEWHAILTDRVNLFSDGRIVNSPLLLGEITGKQVKIQLYYSFFMQGGYIEYLFDENGAFVSYTILSGSVTSSTAESILTKLSISGNTLTSTYNVGGTLALDYVEVLG